MKERECDLPGSIQLNSYFDFDQDNCQYEDTKGPLNCHTAIPKNDVEQLVCQHCLKRLIVCHHCCYKITHEAEVDEQLPENKNLSSRSASLSEQMTRLDFMKDDQVILGYEEHKARNSFQKHLTLPVASVMEARGQLQDKVTKYREQGQILKLKFEEQEKKFEEQEQISKEVIEKLKKEEEKLKKLDKDLKEQASSLLKESHSKIEELENRFQTELDDLSDEMEENFGVLIKKMRAFEMNNFSKERDNRKELYHMWYSPDMYTHLHGYKFCIGVCANGIGTGQGRAIAVQLFVLPGQFDKHLKWPVKAKFTVELVNQRGNENAVACGCESWKKPKLRYYVCSLHRVDINGYSHFIEHSCLRDFLNGDTLQFLVSKVEFC